jgi:hypothetical protein
VGLCELWITPKSEFKPLPGTPGSARLTLLDGYVTLLS